MVQEPASFDPSTVIHARKLYDLLSKQGLKNKRATEAPKRLPRKIILEQENIDVCNAIRNRKYECDTQIFVTRFSLFAGYKVIVKTLFSLKENVPET